MQEIWRLVVIDGEMSAYSISNRGRVQRDQGGCGAKVGRILKPRRNRGGYLYVNIYHLWRRRSRMIHTLVAEAFIGPRPAGKVISHKDDDKINNKRGNLSYITQKSNMRRAAKAGLLRRGSAHPKAKLPERSVRAIKRRAAKGARVCEIAKLYPQVSYGAIYGIARGQNWKHLQAA